MRILLLEPYHTGSHAAWADGYRRHSRHDVEILSLSGANWKWRMHGGAITIARRFESIGFDPDLVLATDMLDVTTFQALTRRRSAATPFVLYFHENQLSYPWSPEDRDAINNRDRHYGFINFASALACDGVYFNSRYHHDSFFEELVRFLKNLPDHNEIGRVEALRAKSAVLPLGLDLHRFDGAREETARWNKPLILWNHRWEYDKDPETFFSVVESVAAGGADFDLALVGENFSQSPEVFEAARAKLGSRVVQYGYADRFEDYARWLCRADVLPVTSNQDFFGASIVEAVYCGAWPLLPRRLAYPELIPEDADVFYDGVDDLRSRIVARIAQREEPDGTLAGHVARFDWTRMAPLYDDAFQRIARDTNAGGNE